MIPPHFPALVGAELRTVFSRGSGSGAVGISFVIGLFAAVVMTWVHSNVDGAQINNASMDQFIQFSAASCAGWALNARNFFVLPLLLLLATGSALAGELSENTLREDLVRPVSRLSVLLAKLIALMTLSAVCLTVTLLPSLAGGAVMFGTEGPTVDLLLGYAATLGTDLGIISFGLLASTVVRSVGGVVVSVILLLIFDAAARLLLWGREKLVGLMQASVGEVTEPTVHYSQLLPGAALDCWKGWSDGWAWEPFAGLAVLVTVCLTVTMVRFSRMDIS